MSADGSKGSDPNGIQVCVRVRPLNSRERDAGYRNCIDFDEATHQVVLSAVDRSTLMQLRGQTAKGYAFDKRYGPEHTSDSIYDDCVSQLVENLFKGYNGTVLAYGQTGAGKTLTMSGGQGIYGSSEKGIIRRAAEQILNHVEAVRAKIKPGESITVKAYALELYNEELRDLSCNIAGLQAIAAETDGSKGETGVRIAERPYGKDGRCIPEVVGVKVVEVQDADSLVNFFADCFGNRAVAATKMNDRSSRSHAIYTVLIDRTLVDVSEGGSKVRTERVESRFNLVDLAGSERVKRSGVTGAAFKEAVHINGGLLALGNVIVALSGGAADEEVKESQPERPASPNKPAVKKHIPYRDSKLTRLLQDSLGGSALTILVACVSSCEADFEETNSTLKYANRACKIKNAPLPNKQLLLEEDLLPLLPANLTQTGNMSMMQMQMLLAEHNRMKEASERREKEKKEKDEKRLAELRALKEAQASAPGYQRLRMAQYDELRKKLVSSHGGKLARGEVIQDDTLAGFKKYGGEEGSGSDDSRPSSANKSVRNRPQSARLYSNNRARAGASPTPWSSDGSRAGTPEISTVDEEENSADIELQDAVDAAELPGAASDSHGASSFVVDAAGEVVEIGSSAAAEAGRSSSDDQLVVGEQALVKELHEMGIGTDGSDGCGADIRESGLRVKQLSQKEATVDEATCMTPHGESIKACYDPQTAACAAETTAPAGRTTAAAPAPAPTVAPTAKAVPAYSVLVFHQQQQQLEQTAGTQEQQTQAAPPTISAPQLLARFKVNHTDTLAVFRAVSPEDFADVGGLLPPNTALPAADKMTYLIARLEVHPYTNDQLAAAIDSVSAGICGIGDAIGPAVGCLMATFGTSLITDCIFDFEDPEQLQSTAQQQRLELWGLQIPFTPIRPALQPDEKMSGLSSNQSTAAADRSKMRSPSPEVSPRRSSLTAAGNQGPSAGPRWNSLNSSQHPQLQSQPNPQEQQQQQHQQENVTCWTSADRLNVSIGLMYALCNLAKDVGAVAGFCVPRPQLLRRWLQSGVKMRQVSSPAKLIYPPSAHDYSYYKSSTVAYFLIDEVQESLSRVLCNAQQLGQQQAAGQR